MLPNFIVRSKNHENYSSCQINFGRNEIVIFLKKIEFYLKN